jgi:hypothetical protein
LIGGFVVELEERRKGKLEERVVKEEELIYFVEEG